MRVTLESLVKFRNEARAQRAEKVYCFIAELSYQCLWPQITQIRPQNFAEVN